MLIGVLVIVMVVSPVPRSSQGAGDAASDRLDALVGRNIRKDSSADMLLKQALQEADKQSFLDRLTPGVLQPDEDVRAGGRATSSPARCSESHWVWQCAGSGCCVSGW